jgi:hypothetical protein
MWAWIASCFDALRAWFTPQRKVLIRDGDTLPIAMPKHDLILLKDGGEDWSVGFLCPCGCGEVIELLLLQNVKPRWDIKVDRRGRPTLFPSVWKATGCKSHFWVRNGRIFWVDIP